MALLGLETYGRALTHAPQEVVPTDAAARLTWGSDLADGARMSTCGDGRVEVVKGAEVRMRIDADGTVHIAGAPSVTKLLALAGARTRTPRARWPHPRAAGP